MKKVKNSLILISISLISILIVSMLSIIFGAREVTLNEVFLGLMGDTESLSSVVVNQRIIRTIFCLISGAALGCSGTLMQSITRNPIADPSVLGVNTGAALFVVVGIAFFNISSDIEYIVLALIGAFVTAIFVYIVGSLGKGGATPIKLALSGVATSAALSSFVLAFSLFNVNIMDKFRFWQVGSVGGATIENIYLITPFLIIGFLVGILNTSALNALILGDDVATGLGVNTSRLRIICAVAGVLLCGSITAIAGPIGFVGLMAPHIIRYTVSSDIKILLPMSCVSGAVILTLADVIGRILGRPGELETGIVTAFIGAPILILIALKSKERSI